MKQSTRSGSILVWIGRFRLGGLTPPGWRSFPSFPEWARDRNSCGGLSLDRSGKRTEAIEGITSLYSFLRGKAGHIPQGQSLLHQAGGLFWLDDNQTIGIQDSLGACPSSLGEGVACSLLGWGRIVTLRQAFVGPLNLEYAYQYDRET